MSYFSKDFTSILSGLNQLTGANGNLAKSIVALDQFWNDSESDLFGQAEHLTSPNCFVFKKDGMAVDNILKRIIIKNKVKANYDLYRDAKIISDAKDEINVNSVFVETIEIDENAPYHDYFVARAREETISYGALALYDWYNLFCSVSGGHWIELKYIAGLVEKAPKENGKLKPLFVIRKKDFSDLRHFELFYNIVNIVESLLNVSEIRMALVGSGVVMINGKKFKLNEILNELALKVCVDPKAKMQKLRTALYTTVRYAGIDAEAPDLLMHVGANPYLGIPPSELKYEKYDKNFTDKFKECTLIRNSIASADEAFDNLKLEKLKELSVEIRRFQFLNRRKDVVTTPRDITVALNFFLNIIKIPGYGRASKYATAPRSEDERDDDYGGIAETFRDNILLFHRKAEEAGFTVTDNENWVHRFLSFLKSTSSGMSPVELEIIIDDGKKKKVEKIKGKKKLLTASLYGDELLTRKMLDVKIGKDNPCRTGTRDVPGKPTRAIYPIKLTTLGAMIVPTYHIVKYVSTSHGEIPRYGHELTSDYISSGSEATSGVRIADNLSTITASGRPEYISLDLDMSNYDSCCIDKNFRSGFVRALKDIGLMKRNEIEYGKDKLSWNELVDFGFGSGYLSGTYWDTGRKPILVLKDEYVDDASRINTLTPLDKITVGDDITTLRIITGCKKLQPGNTYYVSAETCIPKRFFKYFELAYVRDGSDLLYMTSEASGELTTLAMNSIMNLSIQQRLINELKKTKFGSCLDFKTHQAVGDDITILCRVISYDFTTEDINEFMRILEKFIKLYGYKVSLDKTFFSYGQSEYVQTYGIRGLHIAKDQILLIGSERPRRIVDSVAYLEAVKRLLCSKIARGMAHEAAIVIYLYMYRRLMTVDLRRHRIKKVGENVFSCGGISLKATKLRISRNQDDKFGSLSDIIRFVPSIARALMPKNCGGGGLFINSINIVVTEALFYHNLKSLDKISRSFLYSCYHYFKTRYMMVPLSESSNIRVELNEYKLFSMQSLFGDTYMKHFGDIKDAFDLGRLNSENVPRNLVRKGVVMENFMIGVNFREEELETERFVSSLSDVCPRVPFNGDEVLLNFEFRFDEIPDCKTVSFLQGLDVKYQNALTHLGTKTVRRLSRNKTEKIKRLLFRDPVLNLVHSFETIISLLEEYDISTAADAAIGVVLLYRIGMNFSIAQQIVGAYVDQDNSHYTDDTIGACTDDLSSLFDWMNELRFNSFIVPLNIPNALKYRLFVLALQLSFIEYLRSGCKDIRIPTSAHAIDYDKVKRLRSIRNDVPWGFPRLAEFRKALKSKKDLIRGSATLLSDLIEEQSNPTRSVKS